MMGCSSELAAAEEACLIEEVDVGVPLGAPQLLVAGEGPRVQLLVGRDDVDAPPHPLQVMPRWHVACSRVNDDCVWDVAGGQVVAEGVQIRRLALTAQQINSVVDLVCLDYI